MVLFYASTHCDDNPQFYFIPTLCWQTILNKGKRVLTNIGIKFCIFEIGVHFLSKAGFSKEAKEVVKDGTQRVINTLDKIDE